MPHEPFADLVAGVQDLDRADLRLRLVGAAVPEHLPDFFTGAFEVDAEFVFLHSRSVGPQ